MASMQFSIQTCFFVLLLWFLDTSTCQVDKHPSNIRVDYFDPAPSPSSRPLNILLLSTPSWGHINPLLAVAEELAIRGHTVTLCVGIDKSSAKFGQKIIAYGLKYCSFFSDMSTKIKEKLLDQNDIPFDRLLISHLGSILAEYSAGLLHHASQLLSNQSFDLVAGTEFTMPALKCINLLWSVPSVVVGA